MRTARLETIHASSFRDYHQMSLGLVGPQMNKFEGKGGRSPGLMSKRGGGRFPYHVTYPIMYLVSPVLPCRGQSDAYEKIAFLQFHLRAVIMISW